MQGRKCGLMTLDEAIMHAEERAAEGTCGDECRLEHAQLAEWLKELRDMRVLFSELMTVYRRSVQEAEVDE